MSKTRFDKANERTIRKRQNRGFGEGVSSAYKGWLGPSDVPSLGRSHQVLGWKVGRTVQLLSNLELCFCYGLEWDDTVLDYNEQKPLDLRLTQQIAEQEGIIHPRTRPLRQSLPKNATVEDRKMRPVVMSTDFYVIRATGKTAYAIKPKDKLESARVREKLKLEELYWQAIGVSWELVTEEHLDLVLAINVEFVYECYDLGRYKSVSADMAEHVNDWMLPRLRAGASISEVAGPCDEALNLPTGASLVLARHLISRKRWPVDFKKPFHPCWPLEFLNNSQKGEP